MDRYARFWICAWLFVAACLAGGDVWAQEFEEASEEIDLRPRIGLLHQTEENGFQEPFSDLRAFVPLAPFNSDNLALFTDLRLILDNDSRLGFNLGGGFRGYLPTSDLVWGINAFADQRDTENSTYNQVGFGWELLFDRLEVRQNFYVPTGTDRTMLSRTVTPTVGATPFFRQNVLSVAATENATLEQSLRGFDGEVGGRIPGLERLSGDQLLLRGYVGGYYYNNPDLENAAGISGRMNFNYQDRAEMNVFVQHDSFFGTQVGVGMAVYLDELTNMLGGRTINRARDHMNRSVQRKQIITVARGTLQRDAGILDYVDPVTGQVITFTHVGNSGSAVSAFQAPATSGNAGDGTFENPFTSLPATQSTDIVYLHAGSVFDGQNYALGNGQKLLGEGNGMVHQLATSQSGMIPLPAGSGGSARPTISNSIGDAIRLANNSVVANLDITNPTGSGVVANGTSGSTLSYVHIDNSSSRPGTGVHIVDSSLAILGGSIVTRATQSQGIVAENSQLTVTGATVSTQGHESAAVALHNGSTATLKDTTLSTTGNLSDGVRIKAGGSLAANNTTINTAGATSLGVHLLDFSPNVSTAQYTALLANGGVNLALQDSTISTQGVQSHGIGFIVSGPTVSVVRDIHALAATNLMVNVNNSTIRTQGDAASGIALGLLGPVNPDAEIGSGTIQPQVLNSVKAYLDYLTISTQGVHSDGLVFDGASLSFTNSSVTTNGVGAVTIRTNTASSTMSGNTLQANGEEELGNPSTNSVAIPNNPSSDSEAVTDNPMASTEADTGNPSTNTEAILDNPVVE